MREGDGKKGRKGWEEAKAGAGKGWWRGKGAKRKGGDGVKGEGEG